MQEIMGNTGGIVLLILFVAACLTIPLAMVWLRQRRRKWIARNGIEAAAVIKSSRISRVKYGKAAAAETMEGVILDLEVRPEVGAPYPAQTRCILHASDLGRIASGMQIMVRADPENPKFVVVPEWM